MCSGVLRMPPASRLLYYDLGMAADDDGCAEAFAVMRMTGATEDSLNVLVTKGFVRILNEDLVAYITDWQTNNQIRKDRYREGRYKGLIDCACDGKPQPDNQVTTGWQPDGNQMGDGLATEVRLGKDRLGKGIEADKPPARTRFSPPSVQDVADYCREKDCAVDAQRFQTKQGYKIQMNTFCCDKYDYCEIYRVLIEKWEYEDGSEA